MLDVLVIGSGAGGGPLALTLSRAGLKVLVLEKGPDYGRELYKRDEVTIVRRSFFVPSLDDEPHVLVENGKARRTAIGWIANCVGGGTVHMGGYFYRFHPDDFRMRSRFGTYEEIADWPYTYDDLEPYYTRAEWAVGVSGFKDPYEGPRSKPYPMPALEEHPLSRALDRACEQRNLRAFVTPRAINSQPYEGRPACHYCEFCGSYGCPTGAKGSVQEALLSKAARTGFCEIRPNVMVREVLAGRNGRATGCIYLDADGAEHEVSAKVVCVCCSSIESARLLLLSKSTGAPDGLANGNGLVGRHLQLHSFSKGYARFRYDRHPELPLRVRHPFLDRSIRDFYFLPPGVSDLPKGGLIRIWFPHANPIFTAVRLASDHTSRLLWGNELKQRIRDYYHSYRTLEVDIFHDFIPNGGTYVDLDPQVRDKWGLPVARIYLDIPGHHARAGKWLVARSLEVFEAMGADELLTGEEGDTAPHLVHGTCRAGRDPKTSVLNEYCQTHEVPNLFVVDGSFMPTSGGVATTLTILANSFRVADHIVARAMGGDFV